MGERFALYIKTYERDIYNSCLSHFFYDVEGGDGFVEKGFDFEKWNNLPDDTKRYIREDYLKFVNTSFEDETLTAL